MDVTNLVLRRLADEAVILCRAGRERWSGLAESAQVCDGLFTADVGKEMVHRHPPPAGEHRAQPVDAALGPAPHRDGLGPGFTVANRSVRLGPGSRLYAAAHG